MESQERVDSSVLEAKGKEPKARKKTGAKTPTESTGKRSLNLRVDDETYERLTIHAMKRRTTISDLVMELAKNSLREFSVHRVGVRSEGQG